MPALAQSVSSASFPAAPSIEHLVFHHLHRMKTKRFGQRTEIGVRDADQARYWEMGILASPKTHVSTGFKSFETRFYRTPKTRNSNPGTTPKFKPATLFSIIGHLIVPTP